MADDEQFSLCWNNFNTNLSAGFHESLCREDLVDVSLAAEGHIVKAHRLVLSVCSPFFRKMFTQMPTNTHAFVFLNNVSHSALKDLIQFMYCGEVNVKQDALPAFISTAESLQIKGLTDNDPPPQPPQEPTPPPPAAAPQVQQQQQQLPAQRVQRQQQPRSTARYKIETVDDGRDDKGTTQIVIQTAAPPQATIVQQQPQHIQTQQLQTATTTTATLVSTNKRSAQRSSQGGTGAVKRSKTSTTSANVIDPMESQTETTTTSTQHVPQQITVQTTVVQSSDTSTQQVRQHHQAAAEPEETEYIDLPMNIPTKSEPDYSEEHAEVAGDGDTAYVEDDAYGDMRYDDSYFTENEDAGAQPATNTSTSVAATTSKAVAKQQQSQSFSDSSFVDAGGDQGNTEAQGFATVSTKTTATSTLNSEPIPIRKRGRPKTKVGDAVPKLKLLDKFKAATKNVAASKPAVYASTTKGGVKLVYEGHLFKFSFRKAEFSVFQCCFREHGEECKVRVVCDQKNVFPFDGEHVHFMQASDKSVTSSQFMPGENVPAVESKVEILIQKTIDTELDDADEGAEFFEIQEIDETETGSDAPAAEDENSRLSPTPAGDETVDPNDFREKIKRRLQKALQNKKK